MIKQFLGEYRFLSNFYLAPFEEDGLIYSTVEHYFQAHKSLLDSTRKAIRTCDTPGQAKQMGHVIVVRDDWEEIKDRIMWDALLMKFKQNPVLADRLLDTGDQILQEGNYWNDDYWGFDLKTDKGKNVLGTLLMEIRDKLRKDES